MGIKLEYFKLSDFDCQATGENKMDKNFLVRLDSLRRRCKFPFIINSGYRSASHHIEAKKSKLGTHAKGIAADIRVSNGRERALIVENAIAMGFTGIGVAKGFIHVDDRGGDLVMWCY